MELQEILEKVEKLNTQNKKLFKQVMRLRGFYRRYPSNKELKNFSDLQKVRIKNIKNRLSVIVDSLNLKINDNYVEIEKLKNLNPYRLYIFKQQEETFMQNVDFEFVEELKTLGFDTDNIFAKAPYYKMARDILINHRSWSSGQGYYFYSMSNNALEAYENGQKPISKWNKEDLEEFKAIFNIQKCTLKKFKEFLKDYGDDVAHHTSKYYNETMFYSISKALERCGNEKFNEIFKM